MNQQMTLTLSALIALNIVPPPVAFAQSAQTDELFANPLRDDMGANRLIASTQPWISIISTEASFSVEMPNQPQQEETDNNIQGQTFNWLTYESLLEPKIKPKLKKAEYYLVSYTELPKEYRANHSNAQIFNTFGDYIFDKMGLPELKKSERDISKNDIAMKIASGEGYGQSVTTIMHIIDNRFYLTLVVYQIPAHRHHFLNSFKILESPESATKS